MQPETLSATSHVDAEVGPRFFAEQDRVRGGPPAAICWPEYTVTIGSNPPIDLAGHDAFAVGFYAGFPDAWHDIDACFASGDREFVRAILRGTHTGSFFGIPATGKQMAVPLHAMFEIRDGRVARLVAMFDEAGLLRQIGVLPQG